MKDSIKEWYGFVRREDEIIHLQKKNSTIKYKRDIK